jgi:hypothetical protein
MSSTVFGQLLDEQIDIFRNSFSSVSLDGLAIDELYENDVLRRHRHNLILSLEDGLLLYYFDVDRKALPWPVFPAGSSRALQNRAITPAEGSESAHLKYFAAMIFLLTSSATILYPEMVEYTGPIGGGQAFEVRESLR